MASQTCRWRARCRRLHLYNITATFWRLCSADDHSFVHWRATGYRDCWRRRRRTPPWRARCRRAPGGSTPTPTPPCPSTASPTAPTRVCETLLTGTRIARISLSFVVLPGRSTQTPTSPCASTASPAVPTQVTQTGNHGLLGPSWCCSAWPLMGSYFVQEGL